jgi:transposase
MQDTGMTEDSEYLTTEPKKYIIVRQNWQKHRCGKCHSSIVTAPSPARIVPGGSYSDEMIIDATLSKFCDFGASLRGSLVFLNATTLARTIVF